MEVHVRFFLDLSSTECVCCDGEGFHKYAFRKDIVTHTDDFFLASPNHSFQDQYYRMNQNEIHNRRAYLFHYRLSHDSQKSATL